MVDIDLSYNDLTTTPLETVVNDHTRVRSLDLSGNSLSAELFIDIVEKHISRMVNLEELDLKDNRMGPRGAEYLCKALMQHCPKLRYLDLNENGILDESMLHIAYLLQESRLQSLFLVSNHLTPRGLPTLCDGVISSNYIRELQLAFNLLGDVGASLLAKALRDHPTLRSLDISDNGIGDAGAVAIAEHLILSPASRLESLTLSVNKIADIGFTAIAEAVAQTRSPHLRHLDLGCNAAVGPAGRTALTENARHMRHLQLLDLCSCKLTDMDAQRLTEAVLSDTCGITQIEWYNNPAIKLETEKALHEAIVSKYAGLIQKEKQRLKLKLLGGVVFGATLLAGAVIIMRLRRR
ncbi:putative leucine-rich repeat protein [Trypanosoma theileri]|uniref:Putative leucine-rich repeat protein n=1 Tax=Trypanosoma theileri TaxID=67003 RepID=A0A1X0P2M5_9TRYP|nr:putative leucine-rich repeat protein [Trypanosoma theileri]ORC91078.1 putative leucine-rich repeat protein [Trypanosoma theileri]